MRGSIVWWHAVGAHGWVSAASERVPMRAAPTRRGVDAAIVIARPHDSAILCHAMCRVLAVSAGWHRDGVAQVVSPADIHLGRAGVGWAREGKCRRKVAHLFHLAAPSCGSVRHVRAAHETTSAARVALPIARRRGSYRGQVSLAPDGHFWPHARSVVWEESNNAKARYRRLHLRTHP